MSSMALGRVYTPEKEEKEVQIMSAPGHLVPRRFRDQQ